MPFPTFFVYATFSPHAAWYVAAVMANACPLSIVSYAAMGIVRKSDDRLDSMM